MAEVDPKSFCETLKANVDNPKLTDEQFRQFVRNSLIPQPKFTIIGDFK